DGEILKVLLVERGGEPYKGCWAFPGGFLNMDETTDECAVRELEEETGLRDVFVEQLQVFSGVDRDPRGRTITVAYYALVNPVGIKVAGYDDAADARWFTLLDMPSLAFDHEHVLLVALHRLALKVYLQLNGIEELDEHFKGFDLKRLQDLIPDKL
ncbi:MAG: NUDIX domain-containing protein, partial [Butyricimonas faecihominis]